MHLFLEGSKNASGALIVKQPLIKGKQIKMLKLYFM